MKKNQSASKHIRTEEGKMKMKKTEANSKQKEEKTKLVVTSCDDKNCPVHGNLKVRGRTFEGRVTKKLNKRVTIEFERMIYVRKYERYAKSRTKLHARLPDCIEKSVQVGDLIKIRECRPLSKIIHFVVIDKIKDKKEK